MRTSLHRNSNDGMGKTVKQIILLSRIRDLTADGPQGLEAVPDGMDVGHSHKHHLTVWVVLYKQKQTTLTRVMQIYSALCIRMTALIFRIVT